MNAQAPGARGVAVATLDDIPALCDLLAVLFSQEAEFEVDRDAQMRGLTAIVSDPRIGHILVLREGARAIGMVNLLYSVSTALGAKVAMLEDMVIDPQRRGAGNGSRLLSAAIEFARANGCERITLLTDHDNRDAQRFYQRHGFTVSSMLPLRRMLV